MIRLCAATDRHRGASAMGRPCVLEPHDATTPHEDYLGSTWTDRRVPRPIELVEERKTASW